jgi:hypothetical protein
MCMRPLDTPRPPRCAVQTLEEIQRLEEALKTGHMPSEIRLAGDAAGPDASGSKPDGMEVG